MFAFISKQYNLMFLKKTIGFANKNIIWLLLMSLPAAACFTLGGHPLSIVEFFVEMFEKIKMGNPTYTFFEVFHHFSILDFEQPLYILFIPVGLFFVGLIFSWVERAMKYNTMSIGSVRALLLDTLFITFPAGLLFVVFVELIGIIVTGFIALFAMLGNVWLWFGLSIAVAVVAYCMLINFVCYLVCWLPAMSMEGLKIFVALSLSARMTTKNHTKFLITLMSVMILVVGLTFVVDLAGIVSYVVLCSVLNILMCIYLPVYCYTAYFKLADIPLGAKK
ncbi:MAG: hypothetical protein IKA42_05665 [Clostridia bacterium]|nr:hypothetical protein [Clostridia bacterium]